MRTQSLAMQLFASTLAVLAGTLALRVPEDVVAPWIGGPYRRLGIASVDDRPDLSNVSVRLERAGCFGSCPEYALTLYGVGVAVYEGRMFVTTTGTWEFDLPATALLPVLDQLQRLDFMHLDHRCKWIASDVPRYTLSLRVGTREHSFIDITGGVPFSDDAEHVALHVALANVMNLIDKQSRIEQWIGSEAEREVVYEEHRRQQARANQRRIERQNK